MVPGWSDTFGPEKGALIGAVCVGILGALAGLAWGLMVYPPTAWFAVFEAGLPAMIVGAALGAFVGLAVRAYARPKESPGRR